MTLSLPVSSFELGEIVTVDAALRGIVQYGRYHNATNEKGESLDQETGSAAIGDLEIDISPTPRDTLWTQLRFAKGNALNNIGGIELSPYNGPLEDDIEDINGSGRNYLLEAWYRHAFAPEGNTSFAVTGGIIDSTNYIDENRYANDEDSQFMMPPFATPDNTVGNPSYDPGIAFELSGNQWSLNGVYMKTSNDIFEDADYFGAQAGYHIKTVRGPGNYRVLASTSNGRVKKEKGEGEKDAGFLTDGDGDNDEEDSTDDYSDPGDAAAPAEDKEGAPTPAENAREKCVATGRKSVAQRSKMALKTAWVRPTKGIHPSSIRVAWGSTFRCRRRISRTPNGSKRVYLCTKR